MGGEGKEKSCGRQKALSAVIAGRLSFINANMPINTMIADLQIMIAIKVGARMCPLNDDRETS